MSKLGSIHSIFRPVNSSRGETENYKLFKTILHICTYYRKGICYDTFTKYKKGRVYHIVYKTRKMRQSINYQF